MKATNTGLRSSFRGAKRVEYFAKILLASIKDSKIMPNKTETVEIQEFAKSIGLMHSFQRDESAIFIRERSQVFLSTDVIFVSCPGRTCQIGRSVL